MSQNINDSLWEHAHLIIRNYELGNCINKGLMREVPEIGWAIRSLRVHTSLLFPCTIFCHWALCILCGDLNVECVTPLNPDVKMISK